MLARPYRREDAHGVDKLLGFNSAGDVRLDSDELFVVGGIGEPTGVLVYRPGAFLHELQCGDGPMARHRADALAGYAIAHAKAHGLRSAIFLVKQENLRMQKWAESLGAIRQEGDYLYVLTP